MEKATDAPSSMGMFGWEQITEELAVPVIIRDVGRLVPVKIVEQDLMKQYSTLPLEIFSYINIASYHMTSIEADHLNHINKDHCDFRYGQQPLGVKGGVLIASKDAIKLAKYLRTSKDVFTRQVARPNDAYGVVRLRLINDPDSLIRVPFITKVFGTQNIRLVPKSIVQPFIQEPYSGRRHNPSDWDTTFLKMLCIYAKIDLKLISKKDQLVELYQMKDPFSGAAVQFEDWAHLWTATGPNRT